MRNGGLRATSFRACPDAARSVSFPETGAFELIEDAIRCASLAPSGANQQSWKFVVVQDADIKRKIREAAEAEERATNTICRPNGWRRWLRLVRTGTRSFLSCILADRIFRLDFGLTQDAEGDRRIKHYYVQESVGIATGFCWPLYT
jgi:iodotyrosine deiodinase